MKIGIVGTLIGTGKSFGVNTKYIEFAEDVAFYVEEDYDAEIMVINPRSNVISDLDLLILPGGADVAEGDDKPGFTTGQPNVFYEYFDKNVLPRYIQNNTAIFGICRGFQSLNVRFNGRLIQELYNHPYSDTAKHGRWDKVHRIEPTIHYMELIAHNEESKEGIHTREVNSIHHQGIGSLGSDLLPLIIAKPTNNKNRWLYPKVIEAFISKNKTVAGVQWHPEEIECPTSISIIKTICKESQKLKKLKNANHTVQE